MFTSICFFIWFVNVRPLFPSQATRFCCLALVNALELYDVDTNAGIARANPANRPLTIYVKLQVVHGPGMPGTFSPPPTSKQTSSLRSGHTSWHVRHARAVMPCRSRYPVLAGKTFPASGECTTHNLRIWQEAHESCNWKVVYTHMALMTRVNVITARRVAACKAQFTFQKTSSKPNVIYSNL